MVVAGLWDGRRQGKQSPMEAKQKSQETLISSLPIQPQNRTDRDSDKQTEMDSEYEEDLN